MTGMLNDQAINQAQAMNNSSNALLANQRTGSPFARGRGGVMQNMNQNYPNQSPNYMPPE